MLFDQFQGQLSPQTADSARREIQQIKSTQQQAQTQSENMRTMAPAMAQGATAEEAQMLADAGRAGSGLDAIMGVRKNVQGREQAGKLDILKKLADASKGMTPGQQAQAYKSQGMEAPSGEGGLQPIDPTLSRLADAVIDNPNLYAQLSTSKRDELTPILYDRGFTFPKADSDATIKIISEYDTSLGMLSKLGEKMEVGKNVFGPGSGLRANNPYDTEAKNLQSSIVVTKQIVGKALEGGVLRAEDEKKYDKILPSLTDTYEVAQGKLRNLQELLEMSKQIYSNNVKAGKMDRSSQDIAKEIYEQLPDPSDSGSSEGPKFNPQTGRYE